MKIINYHLLHLVQSKLTDNVTTHVRLSRTEQQSKVEEDLIQIGELETEK